MSKDGFGHANGRIDQQVRLSTDRRFSATLPLFLLNRVTLDQHLLNPAPTLRTHRFGHSQRTLPSSPMQILSEPTTLSSITF